jgi:hypothetical protein
VTVGTITSEQVFVARVERLCVVLDKANRRRHRYDFHAASIRAALAAHDANDMWLRMRDACREIEQHNNPSNALRGVRVEMYSLQYEIDEAERLNAGCGR